MANVYDWFEERLEIQALADDVTSKYVPPHVNIFLLSGWNHSDMLLDPVRNWIRNDLLLQANCHRSLFFRAIHHERS